MCLCLCLCLCLCQLKWKNGNQRYRKSSLLFLCSYLFIFIFIDIFTSVCQEFCPQQGRGRRVHGRHGGGGSMDGRGQCTWQGACVVGGHSWWGHAWQGKCMVGRFAWQGACMAGGHAWQEKRQLQWAVHILLECILATLYFEKRIVKGPLMW